MYITYRKLNQTVGHIEIIADGLQATAALHRSIMHAFPVEYIVAFAIELEIGAIDKVIDGQQDAALAADEERLRSTVVHMLGNWKRRGLFYLIYIC